MAITRAKPKKEEEKSSKMEATPVKTALTERQQLDYLTYLSLAALDIGLEIVDQGGKKRKTGFTDGALLDKGGVLSDTAKRIGAVKEDSKAPILSQEDAMYEINSESRARAKRRGKGQMEKKMRRLMRSFMSGHPPAPGSRANYFSFGKGKSTEEAIRLAKQAKAILEAAGFEVLHKPGTRGIHIVGFSKDTGSTVAGLQKYVRKKAMEEVAAYKKRQQIGETSEREALMAKRREDMKDLFKAVESREKVVYKSPPDPRFDEEFRQELREKDPEDAAERILTIVAKPMTQDFDQYELQFLLKRKDVVETLHFYYPFMLFTDQEYKSYVSFMKSEKRGAVAIRTPGRNYLEDLRARQRQGRGSVQPWNAIMENTQRLAEGKKAVFIRSSYASAAQTIAQLEHMYPGRSVSWERSPEEIIAGGGHWTITVAARGKTAPLNETWYQKSFKDQIRLDRLDKGEVPLSRFRNAVDNALAGGKATLELSSEGRWKNVPRWLSSMMDPGKSTQSTLVLKNEYWAKLQSKGIDVPRVIRGTPVYASEKDKKKGKPPRYYTFKFALSGEKFSKNLKLAREKAKAKYGPKLKKEIKFGEPATEFARGKKLPPEGSVAKRLSAMKKDLKKKKKGAKKT